MTAAWVVPGTVTAKQVTLLKNISSTISLSISLNALEDGIKSTHPRALNKYFYNLCGSLNKWTGHTTWKMISD